MEVDQKGPFHGMTIRETTKDDISHVGKVGPWSHGSFGARREPPFGTPGARPAPPIRRGAEAEEAWSEGAISWEKKTTGEGGGGRFPLVSLQSNLRFALD